MTLKTGSAPTETEATVQATTMCASSCDTPTLVGERGSEATMTGCTVVIVGGNYRNPGTRTVITRVYNDPTEIVELSENNTFALVTVGDEQQLGAVVNIERDDSAPQGAITKIVVNLGSTTPDWFPRAGAPAPQGWTATTELPEGLGTSPIQMDVLLLDFLDPKNNRVRGWVGRIWCAYEPRPMERSHINTSLDTGVEIPIRVLQTVDASIEEGGVSSMVVASPNPLPNDALVEAGWGVEEKQLDEAATWHALYTLSDNLETQVSVFAQQAFTTDVTLQDPETVVVDTLDYLPVDVRDALEDLLEGEDSEWDA